MKKLSFIIIFFVLSISIFAQKQAEKPNFMVSTDLGYADNPNHQYNAGNALFLNLEGSISNLKFKLQKLTSISKIYFNIERYKDLGILNFEKFNYILLNKIDFDKWKLNINYKYKNDYEDFEEGISEDRDYYYLNELNLNLIKKQKNLWSYKLGYNYQKYNYINFAVKETKNYFVDIIFNFYGKTFASVKYDYKSNDYYKTTNYLQNKTSAILFGLDGWLAKGLNGNIQYGFLRKEYAYFNTLNLTEPIFNMSLNYIWNKKTALNFNFDHSFNDYKTITTTNRFIKSDKFDIAVLYNLNKKNKLKCKINFNRNNFADEQSSTSNTTTRLKQYIIEDEILFNPENINLKNIFGFMMYNKDSNKTNLEYEGNKLYYKLIYIW